jgi:DNA-binding XRE family transcriptional regulator
VQRSSQIARVRALCRNGLARKIRRAAGATLDELGRDVGVTANCIWLWETGRRSPRGEAAITYGTVLAGLSGVVRGSKVKA